MMPNTSPIRRLAVAAGLLIAVLVACGKEITGPASTPVNVFKRLAPFAFAAQYETAIPARALPAALQQVAFERVRVTLRRDDGTIALDTVVNFPAGSDSLVLALNVPLPANAPASGVSLSLNLGYVNAAGDTVFKGGPIPVTVTPSGGAAPPPVQVPVHYTGPGASAAAVVIAPKNVEGIPGQAAAFTARAVDSDGHTLPGTPVVFVSSNENVVTVGESTGAAVLRGRGTAKVYALLLTGQADSAVVSVTLPAAQLSLASGGGQTAPAGTALPQNVVARVTASDGVGVAGVTVNFAANNGGVITPATAVSDALGNVSARWTLGAAAGAQTLTITSAGLSGSPLTVNATAQAIVASRLSVATQPTNGVAGSTLAPVSVAAQDAAGHVVTTFAGDVTIALGANPGGATLSGTTTVKAVAGVATFSDLKVNRPGAGYTFVISASDLTSATTAAFSVTAGSAARLVVGAVPASVDAGIAIAPALAVTATDAGGNTVTSFTGAVTIAIGVNPGGATLTGTLTRNAVAGVATFDDLSIARAGVGYTVVASATDLTSGASVPFTVSPGPATMLSVVSGANQTAAAGTALQPIVLKVSDTFGNGIAGVTLTLAVTGGGGTVTPTTAPTDAAGTVSVSWTLGGVNGTQTFTVAAASLATLTVNATATGGTSNMLAISTPPAPTQIAGVVLAPSIVVQAKDGLGVVQTGFTGAVTASIASGPAGAPLGGTVSVNAVAGVATFSTLRLTKAGTYTLQFAATGYATATTGNVVINPAPASVIAADSGNAQTGAAGAALPVKLVVLVKDSVGNPVSATTVGWTVATGGGSLSGQTTATDATGRARATWTLGIVPGAQSVTVASTGLAGSPVTFTATAQGVVATTTVTPQLDTMVSFNATRTLTAQAKDGAGSSMTGTFTWVSRTPAVASVNSAGLVTALTNGSTYIVATEAGGTRDSARIVVQQRVASINVTPGARNIYKTRTFTFTASAVDGMGNAVAGAGSPKWTTQTATIATVDSVSGLVTGVALGSTQVRATIGAVTGVATVSVLTPITRIIVGRDSSGVPVKDTTALASLGIGRWFRAEARDTLDALMTGVTFTWFSTNGSVALLDSLGTSRAHALSNANGITTIQATADGITGSSPLKVQQVLASIELGPTPDTIGVTGTVQLTARGKDANNRYITGGSFAYASDNVAVATVNATSGVVTGVTLGTANITATSAAITSNNAAVLVSTTVPPIISFGRDTLTVGRGSSTSIPILLSRPNAAAVTINLAARDTNAYFSTASITIPAGSTSANATLNGRNAGTTLIYATDGSGAGFRGDTAAVAVQANIRMAQSYWYLNATDQVASQVLLSDPSPAGGTYVTFNYATPGVAQVSPDPAFIPAGQLASNVVITALGSVSASTPITPVATGVNGTASTLYVSAPVLTISAGVSARLGAGQYYGSWYVYTPQYTNVSVPLTFTSTDTNIVTVTGNGGADIPAGSYYRYFTVSGRAVGTASVIIAATGWKPDTLAMTVTSPRTTMCCGATINTTSPTQYVTVYATDSTGSSHNRISALALTISSSDTSIVKIVDKTPVIAAGASYVSSIRYQPGGMGGTAYVKVVAGGHRPDSVLITVVGPKLEFSWSGTYTLGTGQYDANRYVYTPDYVTAPLTVTLTSADSNKVSVPATVTIPSGSYYAYFNITGKDTTASQAIVASAPGYRGDTSYYRVTTPKVQTSGGSTYNAFSSGGNLYVYSYDSLGGYHNRVTPLAVTITVRDTNIVQVDSSSLTIGAGTYYNYNAHTTIKSIGSTWVVVSAPGHLPDSTKYTVVTPKLNFNFYSANVGRRQYYTSSGFYVYTPDYRPSPLTVTITQKHATVDSLSATSLTIPTSSYYQYFGFAGLANGADTLIITAPGYLPDTAYVQVTSPKLYPGGISSTALTTTPQQSAAVYVTDSLNNSHYSLDTVVVRVTSSDTTVLKPTQQYVRILPGASYVYSYYNYFGPGTASLTFTDSAGVRGSVTTNTVTVTGPSLLFNTSSTMLGMRQTSSNSGFYVYTQNNVASPVTVNLVSTDPRVATVPSSVTIPAGSYYAYFGVTALDTVGTIQIQATATGFGPASPMMVQVTQPKFQISTSTSLNTTSGAQTITVYAMDANGTTHYTTEAVTVTLASASGAVATIDSSTVTIPAGTYYNNAAKWTPVAAGSTQLSASDTRATLYKYNTATSNVSVYTPYARLSWSTVKLGLGQYRDDLWTGTQDYMPSATTVTLGHAGGTRVTIPATAVVPAGSYYAYYRTIGSAVGTDSVTANIASPYHLPDTAYVVVDTGRIDSFSGWPATMRVGDSVQVTLYTRDPDGNGRAVLAATTFAISGGTGLEVRQGGAVVTSVTVPANAGSVSFYLKATATTTASPTFANALYHSFTPPNPTVSP